MLNLKKIKPIGCKVLVTENVYGYDDENAAGIIVNKKGDLKNYQEVIAIGEDVKFVKPGDVVKINFYKYVVTKENPNSLKAIHGENPVVDLNLDEVELVDDKGEVIPCFLIDQRDVEYIMEDFDEVKYNKKDELIKIPTKKLILPVNRVKV